MVDALNISLEKIMVAVLQRVDRASVTVEERKVSEIEEGLLILLGIGKTDSRKAADKLSEKIVHLRIFEDENGRMNRSLLDIQGSVLVVSQFTLLANTERGRRPGFDDAAPPDHAEPLVTYFVEQIRSMGVRALSGEFGAHMQVRLTNDGPVTIVLESKQ